ncbi:hypothetical protein IMZ48_29285 [Candidatus Bathyarchaeota archaeon]|nr:hypothetical protein [Candidatus Bathyarchaeota archaeon]
MYGENDGVIGDSCGYPLQGPPMSPGFAAGFGFWSVDIQLVMPWLAKSNARPEDDELVGTRSLSVLILL